MIKLSLYNFSKRSNSTKRPSGSGSSVSALLKDATSIFNLTFTIDSKEIANYNYVRWDNRYYYIDDVVHETNARESVSCSLDVLATYRAQIMNTSAYVAYSTSNYDIYIPDGRFSMDATPSIESSSATIITDAPAGSGDGTYILEYATSSATYGPSGAVWLAPASAKEIAQALNSTGYNDFLDQFSKQFNGAYDAVINCRFIPFDWYGRGTGTQKVVLGGYDTGHIGATIDSVISYSRSINIPWQYSDFRNLPPYTSLLMYLPAYGFIQLNPADYIGRTSIKVELYMDGITGIGTYIIGDKVRCTADFSSPVSIGTVRGNATGLVAAGISAVGTVASGGAALPVVGAVAGVLLSQQRSVGNSGVSGGYAGVYASPGNFTDVYLYSICHNTNVEPSNFTAVIGRCLNQVVRLGSLSGYVQTVGASVSASVGSQYLEQINGLLDGGVYLE